MLSNHFGLQEQRKMQKCFYLHFRYITALVVQIKRLLQSLRKSDTQLFNIRNTFAHEILGQI